MTFNLMNGERAPETPTMRLYQSILDGRLVTSRPLLQQGGDADQPGPAATQLDGDVAPMGLDRAHGQIEVERHVLIALPTAKPFQHLAFPLGELLKRIEGEPILRTLSPLTAGDRHDLPEQIHKGPGLVNHCADRVPQLRWPQEGAGMA